jgi:hypothetical protein
LSGAAVCANPPPPADYGPVSEQRGLDINLVETGEVARVVRSFHVNGQHDSKRRRSGFLGSKLFSLLPTVFNPAGRHSSVPDRQPPSHSQRQKVKREPQ